MSLCTSLSGRRKESFVWSYFEYIESKKSSKCIVQNDKGVVCAVMMLGKNPSNLKKHLEARHPATFAELNPREVIRVSGKRKAIDDGRTVSSANQTISACLARSIVTWDAMSVEHVRREKALLDYFVATGCPVSAVNGREFRAFSTAMDPKFKLPGINEM